jgi:hypothetical protein
MAGLELEMNRESEVVYSHLHFDTIAECNRYANNTTRKVAYFCCGGRGIAFEERSFPSIPKIGKGTCDICFLEGVDLVKPCKICVNSLCGECLKQLTRKSCPYCRSDI